MSYHYKYTHPQKYTIKQRKHTTLLWSCEFPLPPPFLHSSLLPCTRKHWIDQINSRLNTLWSLQLLWPISTSYFVCLPQISYFSAFILLPSPSSYFLLFVLPAHFLYPSSKLYCPEVYFTKVFSHFGSVFCVPSRQHLLVSFFPSSQQRGSNMSCRSVYSGLTV